MAKRRGKDRFYGADDIWITPKGNLAVKRIKSYIDKRGYYRLYTKTNYYPGNFTNLKQANSVFGHIRTKR